MMALPPRRPPSVIRPAAPIDLGEIVGLDQLALVDAGRRDYLTRVIVAGACHLAVEDGRICGYLVFEYSFFEQGFVALLYVALDQRRRGIGAALLEHAESLCETAKLFTSTNLSNHAMQSLLARLGYKLSGVIHDLDDRDPELIYVKYLRGG